MKELDFSGINRIACKGFNVVDDAEAGYTVVGEPTPFDQQTADQAGASDQEGAGGQDIPSAPSAQAGKAEEQSSSSISPGESARGDTPLGSAEWIQLDRYQNMCMTVSSFLRVRWPPVVNREYWKTHIPEVDDPPAEELAYWEGVSGHMAYISADSGNDPFLVDMLTAAYKELERVYNIRRDNP